MRKIFLDTFGHLPDSWWNLLLIAFSIVIGLILKLLVHLALKGAAAPEKHFSAIRSVLRHTGKPFNFFLPFLSFKLLLPLIRMDREYLPVINKVLDILLLLSFAAILIAVVKVVEDYILYRYDITKADNLKERKVRTQLQFVRKLMIALIVVIVLCGILLNFDGLRKIGAGLLTGVGVGGIIIGFAAQKSLANFLAGFQIAFTQPFRIDDVLVVENEWGRVEEITLTYVVLLLWDQRRLILPITYFTEKPFQNWTRTGAAMLGTVLLYLDYTAPVEAIRTELTRLLENHPLWDKRVGLLQVTNTTERTIEVRALVSAQSSGKAFDLRCYIREQLIAFIQKNHPGSFPVSRSIVQEGSDKALIAALG